MADDAESLDDPMTASNDRQSRKRASRVQLACDPCRAAKVKCDRTLPICEQCFKRSREATCRYKDSGLRHIMAAHSRSTMKKKMERLEEVVNQLQGALLSPEASGGERLSELPAGTPTATNVSSGRLDVLRNGRSQWTGLSHWQSLMHDITDVKDYISYDETAFEVGDDVDTSFSPDLPDADVLMGTPYLFSISDLLKLLPAKAEMDRYVSTWFSMPEPTRIIVHAPKFQQEYSGFWEDTSRIGPAWLALLLVIACLGAELLGQIEDDSLIAAQADTLRRLAAQALIRADTSNHQPDLIEALILYATAELFRYHDVTPKIWQILGLVIRLCYQAGYHRDPSRNSMFSAFDCEMRRRVWIVAQELEISASCCMGMISSVIPKLSDARLPTNYLDSDFSPTQLGQPRSKEDYTLVQVEISFFSIVQVLGDVSMAAHCREPPSAAGVSVLSKRLEEAHNALPARLKMIPIGISIMDSPSEIADRLRIEMAYQRTLCLLYHRSLGQVNQQRESEKCTNAASTMVQTTIEMLEAARPGGKLAPIKLMLVRHIHDFNFAAILLCATLKHNASREFNLRWDDMRCSTIRSQLLQACQLWDIPGAPSSKAQVALETIRRFLNPSAGAELSTNVSARGDYDALHANTVDSMNSLDLYAHPASLESNLMAFNFGSGEYVDWLAEDRGDLS